jgi:membrane-bound lytic murein transglycosylase B
MRWLLLPSLLIFCLLHLEVFAENEGDSAQTNQTTETSVPVQPSWKHIESKLNKAGFKKKFIKAMQQSYQTNDFAKVAELNVLLFLRKDNYHGTQVTDDASLRVHEFLEKHHSVFSKAEKKYKVPAAVTASLIYIESRYGDNLGRFHVPSVFLSLLAVDQKDVTESLVAKGPEYAGVELSAKQKREIRKRCKVKAKWAMKELKAIQKIYQRSPEYIVELKGSFAGAFGWPQFVPSSYEVYARSASGKKTANLNKADDVIFSVSNYLKSSGWRPKKTKSHLKALLLYNNSKDYAEAILELSRRASSVKVSGND